MVNLYNQLAQLLSLPSHSRDESSPENRPAPLDELIALYKENQSGSSPRHCEATGMWGSLSRIITALIHKKLNRPVLFITPHIPHAFHVQDDMETTLDSNVLLFPAAEAHESEYNPASEIMSERLRICQALEKKDKQLEKVIVAPIQALMQPVPKVAKLKDQAFHIKLNDSHDPEQLCQWLVDHGYNHVDQIDALGDFAHRGGILDIYPPGQELPIRIEFFGDQVESIRYFDIDTQRSIHTLKNVDIASCAPDDIISDHDSLLSYLSPNTVIIIEETIETIEIGRIFLQRLTNDQIVTPVETIIKEIHPFDVIHLNKFTASVVSHTIPFHGQSVLRYENQGKESIPQIIEEATSNTIIVFCEKPAHRKRFLEMAAPQKLPAKVKLEVGYIKQGFELPDQKLIVLTHHEIFGQHQPRRRISKVQPTQAIDSFTDLKKDDLVVHVNHGIGIFRGLKTITKNDRQEEYLALEFANKAMIHVPASKIELIHKYVGSHVGKPKLSKLGAKSWEKQKQKVAQAVEDLAAELIDLQAARQSTPGIMYPPDTDWQNAFEESFPYQDTIDQVQVNTEIKNDMQQPRPMDRLLCGDVGYGKTELSIRAAFKAVEHGKQVAVLVPTTILAQQHYRTFVERLADFPFNIEVLCRFNTAKNAREILERTELGEVDILIGTHRILSGDVNFYDLGLVIIDEEQRFGVMHKERLKQMRKTVDILTMTATPIPRTLHMSLLGLRDISSLTTPPLDRRSILTEVCVYEPNKIKSIINRELAREGQVYFLHNRVHNIQSMADKIQKLLPDARIIVAHGQMSKRELEKKMVDFVNYRADILVSTTIIESGLDIPNANTIIINDADRFGLAELHQLRGRVGRYKNRAYAYMLLPASRAINPVATKRLKAIEEYSQLGSGFRIALRDLEIRGAGNILGIEQSGHIDSIGYELYCRLLSSAVRRQKNEPEPLEAITHLELNISNNIPRSYIPSDRQRMDVYRRLSVCHTNEDLEQLEKDLTDLFGKPPRSVTDLLQLAEIRTLASRWNIKSIVEQKPDLVFHLNESTPVAQLFKDSPGSVRVPDPKTIHLRLYPNYFDSPTTIMATLRKILKKTPSTN